MNNKEIFDLWKSGDRSQSFKQFKLEYQLENGIEIDEPTEQEIITPVPTTTPISSIVQQPTTEKKDRVLRFRTTFSQLRLIENFGYYNKIPSLSETVFKIITLFFKDKGL